MDAKQLTYRRATPDDAEALAAMMADEAVFPGLLQLPYPTAALWRKRLEQQLEQPAGLHLLALDGSSVVGSGGIHPYGQSVRQRHVAGLGMGVASSWHGRGVGAEIMRRLLDYADNWVGYLRIELQVYTDNERAIRLYRKFGFEHEGTLRGNALRDGSYVDSSLMARLHPSLTPPTTA